jgi:large subunit ribosomal protein L31
MTRLACPDHGAPRPVQAAAWKDTMKEGIHPDYKPAKVVCACGNVIETRSTRGDFHIEICSACHPFFTGKQKIMDTAGRIERFKTRYAATTKAEEKKAAPPPPPAPARKAEPKVESRAARRAKANAGKPKPAPKAEAAEAKAEAAPPAETKVETPSA